jgi:hypothetical protein
VNEVDGGYAVIPVVPLKNHGLCSILAEGRDYIDRLVNLLVHIIVLNLDLLDYLINVII